MSSVLRVVWIVTLVAFLAMTCGCSRHVVRTVDDELARDGTGIYDEGGQAIDGYILAGGAEEAFSGRVRIAEQDSLVFWTEQDNVFDDGDGVVRTVKVPGPVVARLAVEALKLTETKTAESVLLIVGGVVLFVGVVAVLTYEGPF